MSWRVLLAAPLLAISIFWLTVPLTPQGAPAPLSPTPAAPHLVGRARPVMAGLARPIQLVIPRTNSETTMVQAADRFGFDRALALAMMGQESTGDPNAVSRAGAIGLGQIMPATAVEIAAELGMPAYDLRDPQTNATMAVYYLKKQIDRFGVAWGLAAYNGGPGMVGELLLAHPEGRSMSWDAVLAQPWSTAMYQETRDYVPAVLSRYAAITQEAAARLSQP